MTNLSAIPACIVALAAVGLPLVIHSETANSSSLASRTDCPGKRLFSTGQVHRFHISIQSAELDSLKAEPRKFVRAQVREGTNVHLDVGLHLKGSIGSFQSIDAKPGLTLDFAHFDHSGRINGLRRLHLNNSVEDSSYANEVIGYELFRATGLPAPRVSHAVVDLNGRRLGMYVVKEAFTEDFLSCNFDWVGGDLYEPDADRDLDGKLKRHSIDAPRTGLQSLHALAQAAAVPDLGWRWHRLQELLDVDAFLRFAVLEVMLCHRDGYCLARNNYRVYFDPVATNVVFFPHGMDQLLGKTDLSWEPAMAGLVAHGLLETPQGREKYRQTFREVFTARFDVPALCARVDNLATCLRPHLRGAELEAFDDEIVQVKDRLAQRQAFLRTQLDQPPPRPLEFHGGFASLTGWVPIDAPASGDSRQSVEDGLPVLRIQTRTNTAASWQTKAILDIGHYRFEGKVRTHEVRPLPFGRNHGAALRVGGTVRTAAGLVGDTPWTILGNDFHVDLPAREVEFICELRASAGEACFALPSLRVVRIK